MLSTTDILTQIMAEVEASDCGLEPAVSGFRPERQDDVQTGRASPIARVPLPSSEDIAGLLALLRPHESIYGLLNRKTASNLLRAARRNDPHASVADVQQFIQWKRQNGARFRGWGESISRFLVIMPLGKQPAGR